ncbi:MAG: alpha-galactosidase [Verrucomicrobia bacterium]|nr:alpha-galactosidase [Verrucomicrobiota bacterium]MCH8527243.1 alpha-galactosidase [Kiritimatiellia bacterium]
MNSLSKNQPDVMFSMGAMVARYTMCPRSGVVEFHCLPAGMETRIVAGREFSEGPHVEGLPEAWQSLQFAHDPEWLVPCHVAGVPETRGFQLGLSMRGSEVLNGLRFDRQEVSEDAEGLRVATHVTHPRGFRLIHRLAWRQGDAFFQVWQECVNEGDEALTLEYFPSFSMGGLTPFDRGEAAEALYLHRFRSCWSAEGRHERRSLEALNLERSWAGYGRRVKRFGQTGSMPIRGFFPWMAVEDAKAGVMWGAQLAAPGSWHLELSRLKDRVVMSGGLPSRDMGEWWKTLPPGGTFASPPAVLACVCGDVDDLCHALLGAQERVAPPEADRPLPMVFNEWCTSWGEPTHADVADTARKLSDTLTKIIVIDDGWATKPKGEGIQFNGDWVVDREKFPGGLKATTDVIRSLGMIPGLWFEMEVATRGTEAFKMSELLLRRGGHLVEIGSRRFWDFRNAETVDLLTEKVIRRLKDDGFGYLKIDYNETLPAGLDGPDSPGEELRKHLAGVQAFIRKIQAEIPGILVENCSSGGHRLEPSFMGLCAMGSFSDAHETWSIPIIAANLQRLILPRQSQIWCVLHPRDSLTRIRYGLAATFLGRMAISGEVKDLNPEQMETLKRAQAFLDGCADIIRRGKSRIIRGMGESWNAPRGWQGVVRVSEDGSELMAVAHVFGDAGGAGPVVPLPPGDWRVADAFGLEACPERLSGSWRPKADEPFSGFALRLRRVQG